MTEEERRELLSNTTKNWIIGTTATVALTVVGFYAIETWALYQTVADNKALIAAQDKQNEDFDNSIDRLREANTAQWRLLRDLADHKNDNDARLEVIQTIQTEFVMPALISSKPEDLWKPNKEIPLETESAGPPLEDAIKHLKERKEHEPIPVKEYEQQQIQQQAPLK